MAQSFVHICESSANLECMSSPTQRATEFSAIESRLDAIETEQSSEPSRASSNRRISPFTTKIETVRQPNSVKSMRIGPRRENPEIIFGLLYDRTLGFGVMSSDSQTEEGSYLKSSSPIFWCPESSSFPNSAAKFLPSLLKCY